MNLTLKKKKLPVPPWPSLIWSKGMAPPPMPVGRTVEVRRPAATPCPETHVPTFFPVAWAVPTCPLAPSFQVNLKKKKEKHSHSHTYTRGGAGGGWGQSKAPEDCKHPNDRRGCGIYGRRA